MHPLLFTQTLGPFDTPQAAAQAAGPTKLRWVQQDIHTRKYWITGPVLTTEQVIALIEALAQDQKTPQ